MPTDIPPQPEVNLLQVIQDYRHRCEEEPESYLFFPLAEAYRQLGRFEEAISICQEGLQKHPDYWEIRVTLGRIYKDQQRMDEAQAQLEAAVANQPGNLLAHQLLGEIYLRKEQTLEAIDCYRTILQYYPESSQMAQTLTQLEEKEQQYQQRMLTELETWKKGLKTVKSKYKRPRHRK